MERAGVGRLTEGVRELRWVLTKGGGGGLGGGGGAGEG